MNEWSMWQRPIGYDCGVLAIAFALEILNGFAKIEKRLDIGRMRSHLVKCQEEEEFTLFLRSHKHTKLSKGYREVVSNILWMMAEIKEFDSF